MSRLPPLPLRLDSQSLHAYVREHLDKLECLRWAGVPYATLAEALDPAGFAAVGVRTIQTAVYRARHETCKKAAKAAAARGGGQVGRSYMGQRLKDRAEVDRQFHTPTWPLAAGKRDPLA
jgi:hypothetical protein